MDAAQPGGVRTARRVREPLTGSARSHRPASRRPCTPCCTPTNSPARRGPGWRGAVQPDATSFRRSCTDHSTDHSRDRASEIGHTDFGFRDHSRFSAVATKPSRAVLGPSWAVLGRRAQRLGSVSGPPSRALQSLPPFRRGVSHGESAVRILGLPNPQDSLGVNYELITRASHFRVIPNWMPVKRRSDRPGVSVSEYHLWIKLWKLWIVHRLLGDTDPQSGTRCHNKEGYPGCCPVPP